MQQLDIPIIHKTYELYRALHELERTIPKMERFTVWQRSQNLCLDILQGLLSIGYQAPEGMAVIADLMYFKDGAPSLEDVAKAEMWAFETGTKQVPTNVQKTTFGINPSYPAMRESVGNTPFIGGPGYLFQIQVNEKAIFCLATNFVNAAEMGRTIKFGGF